jgi:hypothetical protein
MHNFESLGSRVQNAFRCDSRRSVLLRFGIAAIISFLGGCLSDPFTNGSEAFAAGQWESAITQLSRLDSSSEHYDSAQALLAVARTNLATERLESARSLARTEHWDEALERLTDFPSTHPQAASADSLRTYVLSERATGLERGRRAEAIARAAAGTGAGETVSVGHDSGEPSSPSRGDVVKNSAWNGSVRQVERYLKREILKDPDSYQSIEWSQVQKMENGGYMVRHTFRAKNSFGGYAVSTYGFILDSEGNVVSAIPME